MERRRRRPLGGAQRRVWGGRMEGVEEGVGRWEDGRVEYRSNDGVQPLFRGQECVGREGGREELLFLFLPSLIDL